MGIELTPISAQNISGYVKVNGEIMMNQDNESKVGSIIPGRVSKIFVQEGSFVRAGQTLAYIENPELINAQVEYLEAKHEFEHTKTEFDRQQTLSSDNIGSKKDLAKINADYEHAVIGLKSAEQKLLTYKISIPGLENYEDIANHDELQRFYPVTSPIAGKIASRNVTVGQYIEPSVDMFHVVNTSTVFADLSIFEKDLPYVKTGQKVMVETGTNNKDGYEGKISFINNVFDDENRSVKVRVSVGNKSGELYPFMFVTAKIFVNNDNVPAVPLSSIEADGENKYIFIKTSERRSTETHEEHSDHGPESIEEHKAGEVHHSKEGIVFKKVKIRTGISDDKYTEIYPAEDLNEGMEVVSKGTFYLKSELMKDELGEHEH
ncbi:MAG TPA: efflux RND transporter periplasmic adaptor subunit [Ignavibacteria bacterium]|nr:efflux RND transporter periplasmic adaptor subunit [Ignavibacteria bacterium]